VIVLVGFMGAGKTTVGHLLSTRLGVPFVDSDLVIEQRSGLPVRQIFAEDGEPAFRALEHEVIVGLLDGPDLVLAVGGGAPEHPGTRALLARGDDPANLAAPGGGPRPPREGIARGDDPADLAAPGGGPRPPLRLATAQVVYLAVGYDQAMARVGGDPGRPLLARPDLAATYQRRLPLYAGIATLTVATDGRRPETIATDILARLVTQPAAGGRAP
jgi:shikimate kinase